MSIRERLKTIQKEHEKVRTEAGEKVQKDAINSQKQLISYMKRRWKIKNISGGENVYPHKWHYREGSTIPYKHIDIIVVFHDGKKEHKLIINYEIPEGALTTLNDKIAALEKEYKECAKEYDATNDELYKANSQKSKFKCEVIKKLLNQSDEGQNLLKDFKSISKNISEEAKKLLV